MPGSSGHASHRTTPAPGRPAGRKGARARLRAAIVATVAASLLVGLTACTSSTGSGSGSPITVTGAVVDVFGAPLPNVHVLVGTTTATTAADGTFTITAVSTPYDLAIYLDASQSFSVRPIAVVYQGLTLAHPTLGVPGDSGVYAHAYLGGTLPRQLDAASNEAGMAFPAGAYYAEGGTALDASNTPAFGSTYTSWGGSAPRVGFYFVITADIDTNTNLPTAYTGYAAMPLTLEDGVDQTALSVPLSTSGLSTVQVQGSVTPPSGYTVTNSASCGTTGNPPCLNRGSTVLVRFTSGAAGASLALAQDTTAALVPRYSGGTLDSALVARAEPSGATTDDAFTMAIRTATTSGPNDLTLPAPPAKLTPADGATGVTAGTEFSWGALSNSDYMVHLSPTSSSSDPEIYLFTAATHATLPDLSALGVQLPTGQVSYAYDLATVGPFSSVDDLVNLPDLWMIGQEVMGRLFPNYYTSNSGPFGTDFPVPDLTVTQSASTTFTTP